MAIASFDRAVESLLQARRTLQVLDLPPVPELAEALRAATGGAAALRGIGDGGEG